jgi:hypothetical protein
VLLLQWLPQIDNTAARSVAKQLMADIAFYAGRQGADAKALIHKHTQVCERGLSLSFFSHRECMFVTRAFKSGGLQLADVWFIKYLKTESSHYLPIIRIPAWSICGRASLTFTPAKKPRRAASWPVR